MSESNIEAVSADQHQQIATADAIAPDSVPSTVQQQTKASSPANGIENASTTFEVPPDSPLCVSLPLKKKWALWYLNEKKDEDWTSRLKCVFIAESLEKFIALYDNIRPPSRCPPGCDYNLFRDSIQPMWEVEENKKGGRLMLFIDRGRPDILDILWTELLFGLVGNQFGSDSQSICGAVCNIRQKGCKISLWTTNGKDDEANKRIGQTMKDIFCAPAFNNFDKSEIKIRYEEHKDVQDKRSSRIPERFTL